MMSEHQLLIFTRLPLLKLAASSSENENDEEEAYSSSNGTSVTSARVHTHINDERMRTASIHALASSVLAAAGSSESDNNKDKEWGTKKGSTKVTTNSKVMTKVKFTCGVLVSSSCISWLLYFILLSWCFLLVRSFFVPCSFLRVSWKIRIISMTPTVFNYGRRLLNPLR
jgi:hypothetical protein